MDLTSSHIDDATAGWSGRSEKKFQLTCERGKILVIHRWAGRLGVRPTLSISSGSSHLSETARFAQPHTPGALPPFPVPSRKMHSLVPKSHER